MNPSREGLEVCSDVNVNCLKNTHLYYIVQFSRRQASIAYATTMIRQVTFDVPQQPKDEGKVKMTMNS
jgi:hypothetical protein